MALRPLTKPNSTGHPNPRGAIEIRSRPAQSFRQEMFRLTNHIRMVHLVSGNPASPYGVRQLAAAFLPSPRLPVTQRRFRPLWNHSLTNCKFLNSFILTFMQIDGGRGYSLLTADLLSPVPPIPIPFLFKPLRTLLHSFALFCTRAKFNSFPFMGFRTLSQKQGGVRVGSQPEVAASAPWFS